MAEFNAPVSDVDPVWIEINEHFNKMIYCVNQRREAVLAMYHDLRQEIASRPIVRARMEQELIGLRDETENRIQMNHNLQFQQKIITDIDLELAKIRTPHPDTRVVFRCQSVSLEKLISELGEFLEEEVIPVPDYQETQPVVTVPDYQEMRPVVTVPDYQEMRPVVTVPDYQAMRPVVAVGRMGMAPGELWYPHAIAIDSDDRIFVTESFFQSHGRVSVFSEKGEFLTCFSHQDMRELWGIAIHGDNLYVTDKKVHSIFHFKIETDFPLVAKRGTKGQQVGRFNDPRNLAVSNNGDVYVADCSNNRVQILNSSLLHPRILTQQRIHYPHDIKLTADEVYVLCNDNPCVLVFSHAGERLRSLVSRGYQMQVTYPSFFCLDSAENIIISDWESYRIKIFTKEGNLLTTIGEEGEQAGMFVLPTGLAITKELNLIVVSQNKNSVLQIFSCF